MKLSQTHQPLAVSAAGLLAAGLIFPGCAGLKKLAAPLAVERTAYHGWPEALRLRNGTVEATVVPSIGRLMQFQFIGEENVIWENRALDGKSIDVSNWRANEWVNFGGDKAWPSPEADWPQFTKRSTWRPPPAFDGMPFDAHVDGSDVVLTSAVDPYYGIRVQRRIHLDECTPVLTIVTTYERVSGEPAKSGVWIVTQLGEPDGVFVMVPADTRFSNGYCLLGKTPPPPSLKFNERTGNVFSLTRDPRVAHKIGTEGSTLLWVGKNFALRIESPRVPPAGYPDQGSSAEVYTNPDPLKYIELEMLSPLRTMKAGDRMSQTNTYTLFRRTEATAEVEARRILNR